MIDPTRNPRKFGLLMAGAFSALSLLLLYRHRVTTAVVGLSVAGAFALLALIVPKALAPIESLWMSFAHALGYVNTRVLTTVFFFLVITPLALLMRAIGRDKMRRAYRASGASGWEEYRPRQRDPHHYKNMF